MCAQSHPAENLDSASAVERSVVIHARRATVFRFFTDPARFARWWAGPGGGIATIDPRPGGSVRIEYHGGRAVMSGTVVESTPDERFVFTWGYEKGNDAVPPGSSRVEVTLTDHPEGTLLRLRHTGLPNIEQVQGHNGGWRHYLAVVASECAAEANAGVPQTVALWFEAWATADSNARGALLQRCLEDDAEFRDAFSAAAGIDEINAHISNARQHMPGVTLAPEGSVACSHGYAKIAWTMSGVPAMGTIDGTNVFRVAPSGKLRAVIGFWNTPGA
jgi:uncharacterized protein YndB with AHSA1/START domain